MRHIFVGTVLFCAFALGSFASSLSYSFSTDAKGIADGTVTLDAPNAKTASLYYGDENGVLQGYSPFAELTLTNGKGSFTLVGNHCFPKDAACVIALTDDGEKVTYELAPERRRDAEEKPLFTYYQVSDFHICDGRDYWPEMTVNRNNLAKDVIKNRPAFVSVAGDIANNSVEGYYTTAKAYFEKNFNKEGIPAFPVNGNHEFYISDKKDAAYDRAGLMSLYEQQFKTLSAMGIIIDHPADTLYYSTSLFGYKFIYLSVPSPLDNYKLTDEQLEYLDEKLYENEDSTKTAFVVMHCGPNSGLSNKEALDRVLAKHPNTLVASGHTHVNLAVNRASGGGQQVSVGDMTRDYSYFNDGCSVWTMSDKPGEQYEKGYSIGQVVEVYADKIVIMARQFLDESRYLAHGLYMIPTPTREGTRPNVSIGGEQPNGGVTLTAFVNGVEAPEGYKYTWLIGGKTVSEEPRYTVGNDTSFIGKPLHLRVTCGDGTYVSCTAASPVGGFRVEFDANGGEGTVPEIMAAAYGQTLPIAVQDVLLYKKDRFFTGFSTDKTAAFPDADVTVTGNTKLYAVYSSAPVFRFEAGMCGFVPNASVTAALSDGVLHLHSDGGRLTMPNLDADFSAYDRIRLVTSEASGVGGIVELTDIDGKTVTVALENPETTQKLGALYAYEYRVTTPLPSRVTTLVYRPNGIDTDLEELSFANKTALYGTALTYDASGSVSAPSDAPYTVGTSSVVGGKVSVTLLPKEGYTFTSRTTLINGTDIDGRKPYDAVVNEDGSAVIIDSPFSSDSFTAAIGDVSGSVTTFSADVGRLVNKGLYAVAYDAGGRVVGDAAYAVVSTPDGKARVLVDSARGAENVRLYVFDKLEVGRYAVQTITAEKRPQHWDGQV